MKEELKKLRAKVEADALAREEVEKKFKIKEEELEKLEAELNSAKDESLALRLQAELQRQLGLCREHTASLKSSREHHFFVLEKEKVEAEVKLENALEEKNRVEEQLDAKVNEARGLEEQINAYRQQLNKAMEEVAALRAWVFR